MAKRRFANLSAIQSAATGLSSQDRVLEANDERVRETRDAWSLPDIRPRESDTRQLHATHVLSLVESISALGLIEPLVVDRKGQLLAGGHRRAALEVLSNGNVEAMAEGMEERAADLLRASFQELNFDPDELQASFRRLFPSGAIPVRVMEVDAESEPQQALAIEVAENEQRRDYTRDEVLALAERLKAAGYRAEAGRPKAGEKALAPALQVVVGKSLRTVRYILSGSEPAAKSPPTDIQVIMKLRKAVRGFKDAGGLRKRSGAAGQLAAHVRELDALIDAAIEEARG